MMSTTARIDQRSQAEKHEMQLLREQSSCLKAELASVTEDRYELQVILTTVLSEKSACVAHTSCLY